MICKPVKIPKGDPCPKCKGHAFEIVKRGYGITMLRCLECDKVVVE